MKNPNEKKGNESKCFFNNNFPLKSPSNKARKDIKLITAAEVTR